MNSLLRFSAVVADGQFYTDERTVLMQKHMAVAVNGKIVLDPH
jgi:hypothetical protein